MANDECVQEAVVHLGVLLCLPDEAVAAAMARLTPRGRDRLAEALRRAESGVQGHSESRGGQHIGMAAHDGLAPHSHEVRPDHRGVELLEPGGPAGALGLGVPYAPANPDTGIKVCPACCSLFPEEYGEHGELLTSNYTDHYVREHASLPDAPGGPRESS